MKEIEAINKMKTVLRNFEQSKDKAQDTIFILSTGGTLDKVHNPISEALEFDENSHIEQIMVQSNAPDFRHMNLMRKDSADMTQDDRQAILEAVRAAPEKKILITHGTSTMVETAQFLTKQTELSDKAIVLTGAMRPFSLMRSDAPFNLGCAIGALNVLDKGVFITMNGNLFTPDNVIKNVAEGRFQTLE